MNPKIFTENTYTLAIIYHLGAYENSIHMICDHATKKACIVDPAWDGDLLINTVKNLGYELEQIWITHWHPDHNNAVDELVGKTGASVFAGANEKDYLLAIESPINYLNDNQTINIGNTIAKVLFTPGHTAGGTSFLLDNRLILGDTIFIYGAGHCAMPGANVHDFFQTMKRLKTLPNEIYVHSGHDYGSEKTTTLGEQKHGNPFLLTVSE